ncbi:MAG: flavohemoglobin expression-modulating QEGLA motif protein [Gammaproteobacteria bacterium]
MTPLTEKDIAFIAASLADNKPVRHHIRGHGRLHIDRQLPFLVVYRRPGQGVDTGTDRLLLGEASYLTVEEASGWQEELSKLVTTIARIQTEAFGAFLFMEIWAGQTPAAEHAPPGFRIFAPCQNCPAQLLEKFQNALLNITISKQKADVTVNFTDRVNPPGLNPLLDTSQLSFRNWLHLGLEVTPIYRDRHGTLFPFKFKELHQKLARALKRTFYEFIHLKTSFRPSHYHELGRRAMTQAALDTDRQLASISNKFDLLLHVTPVNASAAWEQFKSNCFQRHPEFLYRARPIDPGLLKRQLFKIPLEHIEDPTLAHIFSEKREELDRQITLMADRNTRRFLLGSRQLYGDPEEDLLCLAERMLKEPPAEQTGKQPRESISAFQFYDLAKEEVRQYHEQDNTFNATVELRDDVSGVLVSHGNLLIGSDTRISANRIQGVLAHEVGTHMLTSHNGRQQPLQELYAGMAGYEPMQEGLAVLGEYLAGEIDASRLRLLAGRVMAVKYITEGADFIETFNHLYTELGFDSHTAFYITMRVFRGGGYTKDVVYLRGLNQVLDHLASGKELEPLYLGKISHEHLFLIQELQLRKVLQPPALKPRFLGAPPTQKRLQKLYNGLTVLDLIEDN